MEAKLQEQPDSEGWTVHACSESPAGEAALPAEPEQQVYEDELKRDGDVFLPALRS